MSLLDEFCSEFCIMEKTRQPDGEGGFITGWADGARFKAAVRHDTTILAQQAEKAGTASTFFMLVDKRLSIMPYDYVKRISDGQTFRITSDPKEEYTPASLSINKALVSMQKASLPT